MVSLVLLGSFLSLGPLTASAYAEPCPNEQLRADNGSSGLPDCRAYEIVSPVQKFGKEAGAPEGGPQYSIASPDGSRALFITNGPIPGTSTNGLDIYSVAERSTTGWRTVAALPAPEYLTNGAQPFAVEPSLDLSNIVWSSAYSYTPLNPGLGASSGGIYRDGLEGSLIWLSQPTIANPDPAPGVLPNASMPWPAGGSLDLDVIYFTYKVGTLVQGDAVHVSGGGLYEWRNGALDYAGILPDKTIDPDGAVPAATIDGDESAPNEFNNQVSVDGNRAFFVSPDPAINSGGRVPQLYVRKTAADGEQATVLVSASAVTDDAARNGPLPLPPANSNAPYPYVYASPDGSNAIFESVDQLTNNAPNNTNPKAYDFNTDTNTLSYLPNVTDEEGGMSRILTSTPTGGSFVFEKLDNNRPEAIDLWSSGRITTIARLSSQRDSTDIVARITSDGSIVVFLASSPIADFNDGGEFLQLYRYTVNMKTLTCASCPPAGVAPSGDVGFSHPDQEPRFQKPVDSRGISDNGNQIFFDSPDPLVPRDVDGTRDVYEWENGQVYLISSGAGSQDSFFLDNSESGDDVFFATSDSLVTEDTDGGYDVYDASVDGGFSLPVAAASCLGEACQGSLNASPFLLTPLSSTFVSANLTPTHSHVIKRQQATHKRTTKRSKRKLKPGRRKVRSRKVKTTASISESER